MTELTAEDAAKLSREDALRVMATAEGIDPSRKRLALLMLDGPEIAFAEESRLRAYWPKLSPVVAYVRGALEHMKFEAIRDEQVAHEDLAMLGRRG